MNKLLILLIFAMLPISALFGVGMRGAKILQVSTSGKSIKIDRGELQGVREGDKGKFLFQTKGDSLQVFYVAAGEAVKVYAGYSYWYLRELKKEEYVKEKNDLIITSSVETLKGRRSVRINQQLIVLLGGQSGQHYVETNQNVVPDELIKKDKEFTSVEVDKTGKNSRSYDFNSKSFINWSKGNPTTVEGYFGELGTSHISELRAVDRKELISRRDRERIHNTQIDGVVEKYNE